MIQDHQDERGWCPRCGTRLRLIEVHGHTQCVECGSVVDDCCQGEVCQEKPPHSGGGQQD